MAEPNQDNSSTTDAGATTAAEAAAAAEAPFVPPVMVATTATNLDGTPASTDPLYPRGGPDPAGTKPGETNAMQHANDSPASGSGTEGEDIIWEARYSMWNFLGRITILVLLTIGLIALAILTWGPGKGNYAPITIILGIVLGVFWLMLLYRMAQARYGHYYRLTNRRLFVSTGLMRRRRDQMELLRVKDVYTRQTLVERWMSLGTVVVVSNEKELPIFYISGVANPKQVMDLVWSAARTERDTRSTNVQSV
jgi:membrane protein YdbS with pleckstrin-like domain